MANINKENVSKAEQALQMAHKDMLSFGKLFLADDFMRSETPWFHYEIADDIMNHDKKQLAIIMPRGHGSVIYCGPSVLQKKMIPCFMVGYLLLKNLPQGIWTMLNLI